MTNYTITKAWFEDIKERVANANAYYFVEYGLDMVEVDVDEEAFIKVSKELGWM